MFDRSYFPLKVGTKRAHLHAHFNENKIYFPESIKNFNIVTTLEKKRNMATDKKQLTVPTTKLTIWLEKITEKCCHDIKQEL